MVSEKEDNYALFFKNLVIIIILGAVKSTAGLSLPAQP